MRRRSEFWFRKYNHHRFVAALSSIQRWLLEWSAVCTTPPRATDPRLIVGLIPAAAAAAMQWKWWRDDGQVGRWRGQAVTGARQVRIRHIALSAVINWPDSVESLGLYSNLVSNPRQVLHEFIIYVSTLSTLAYMRIGFVITNADESRSECS